MGFTCALSVTREAVVSYTAFPPLPGQMYDDTEETDTCSYQHTSVRAVYFCCTGLGVTSTGRYPASCPVKPGLSSSAAFRHLQPRLSVLLNTFSIILSQGETVQTFLPFRTEMEWECFRAKQLNYTEPSVAPSSTIRSFPSAAPVASASHRSFCGCPSCPFTQ